MKSAIFIFVLFVTLMSIKSWAGLPPTTAAGQNQSNITTFNFKVPNNLATNIGGGTLLESGNNNILVNPSFEHSTYSTSWTSAGTGSNASESTNVVHGRKSFAITTSSQTIDLSQSSTLYASQFASSVQGLASIRVKTNHTGTCNVCSVQAGTVSTTNCVSVTANNTWGLYKVPMLLGATSNGISLVCASGTGLTYVDDAFVGAVDLKADVDQTRIAGVSYIPGTANCIFRRASTSLGTFSDINSVCPGPTILESSMGSWQTTDANTPRQTINNLPMGKYRLSVTFMGGPATTSDASFALTDGTTTCPEQGSTTTTDGENQTVDCVFNYNSSGNRTFDLYGRSSTGSLDIYNQAGTGYSRNFTFTLTYLGSQSIYTSTNADTDWAACSFSSSAWQGLGTVTSSFQCKREGADLLMRGNAVFGTSSASEARIPLPTWNGSQLSITGSTIIPAITIAGRLVRNQGGATVPKDLSVLMTASQTYLNLSFIEDRIGQAPLSPALGSSMFNNGETVSIDARIPISGWTNSNIIIGQFNGLESCTDSYECTDVFSAKGDSSDNVTGENIDWINGNCTNATTGFSTCTFRSGLFTTAPNCNVTMAESGSNSSCRLQGNATSTSVDIVCTTIGTTPTAINVAWNLSCQKQGADYIGKTAKAVASDQNVSSPGTLKSTLCSAKISATGAITDHRGGCFSSCTNATTPVCTFTSNYWVSGSVPNCWHTPNAVSSVIGNSEVTSTTFYGRVFNSSIADISGARVYFCQGERQ